MIERQVHSKGTYLCLSKRWPDSAANPKNLPVEFTFDESLVRTIVKDGEAWFVAKDVCEILDIGDPSKAVRQAR